MTNKLTLVWLVNTFTYINVCIIVCMSFILDSTYTVEEAVEKLGFGSFQLLVTVFSGLLWVSRELQ